jgi:predicted TIM-barrel fold metal-dependent hydrolase
MYASMLDILGLGRGVIVHASSHGTDNRVTLDAIARMGGRCRGIALVAPSIADHELEELHRGGMRGIRISTMLRGETGIGALERMADRLKELSWNIELHLDKVDELVELAPTLRRLPVDIVFDHMGRVRGAQGVSSAGFQVLIRLLTESDRYWVKISSWYRLSDRAAPYDDMRPIVDALIQTRLDRLLWGSNWPHPLYDLPVPDDGVLLDQFQTWAGEARRPVLVDNPAKLYGFE